jgi:exosome complex component MTR3
MLNNCYKPAVAPPKVPPVVAPTFAREGARSDNHFRQIFTKLGVIDQAAGSSHVQIGQTKVVCGVYGPREGQRPGQEFSEEGQLVCDFKFAPFACRDGRRLRGQGEDEQDLSIAVQNALHASVQLHKLPKSVIDIYIVVLQADGGELGAAITAASLALADAGIELYDLVAACSAGCVVDKLADQEQGQQRLILDPSLAEVADPHFHAQSTLAVMPTLGGVTTVLHAGPMSALKAIEAAELCAQGCGQVHAVMKQCLLARVQERQSEAELRRKHALAF